MSYLIEELDQLRREIEGKVNNNQSSPLPSTSTTSFSNPTKNSTKNCNKYKHRSEITKRFTEAIRSAEVNKNEI